MAKFFFLVLFALVAVAFAFDEDYIREGRSAYNNRYPSNTGHVVGQGYYPNNGMGLNYPPQTQQQQVVYPGGLNNYPIGNQFQQNQLNQNQLQQNQLHQNQLHQNQFQEKEYEHSHFKENQFQQKDLNNQYNNNVYQNNLNQKNQNQLSNYPGLPGVIV